MAGVLITMLQASIWMIDFEKTYETTPGVRSDSRDDGYLTGLDSAIDLLSNLILPAAKPSSEWQAFIWSLKVHNLNPKKANSSLFNLLVSCAHNSDCKKASEQI